MCLSSTDVNFTKNRRTKMTYKTSTENKALEIVNVKSLEGKVKQSMEAAEIKVPLAIFVVALKMSGH